MNITLAFLQISGILCPSSDFLYMISRGLLILSQSLTDMDVIYLD